MGGNSSHEKWLDTDHDRVGIRVWKAGPLPQEGGRAGGHAGQGGQDPVSCGVCGGVRGGGDVLSI